MSPLSAPTPSFEIGENPNPNPNPINSDFPCQSGYDLGGYPRVWVLLPCLVSWLSTTSRNERKEIKIGDKLARRLANVSIELDYK
jgi:hypothetical protein